MEKLTCIDLWTRALQNPAFKIWNSDKHISSLGEESWKKLFIMSYFDGADAVAQR